MTRKIEEAIELRSKDKELKKLLCEIHELNQNLEHKVIMNEENLHKASNKIQELIMREEMLNSRINSLELDLQKAYDRHDLLDETNEDYYRQMSEKDRRIASLEKELRQIQDNRSQIVSLESRCKSLENTIETLRKQLQISELEKKNLKDNYDQLSELLKQTELYINQGEEPSEVEESKATKVVKTELQKVKLDVEVKTKEVDTKNNYIQELQGSIEDLKNKLALAEELSADLRFTEDDLKMKVSRLEEECENIRKENTQLRMNLSTRKGPNAENLSRELNGFGIIMNERASLLNKYGAQKSLNQVVEEEGEEETKEAAQEEKRIPSEPVVDNNTVEEPAADKKIPSESAIDKEITVDPVVDKETESTVDQNPQTEHLETPKENSDSQIQKESSKEAADHTSENPKTAEEKLAIESTPLQSKEEKTPEVKVEPEKKIETIPAPVKALLVKEPARNRLNSQAGQHPLKKLQTFQYQEGMFARDYLNLAKNPTIIKMLQSFKEETDNLVCFSDQMIRINHRENKEKRVILVTRSAIYNLHPRKNFKVIRRIDITKLHKLTVPESSALLLALHVTGEYDYLLEVFRRPNLILFLIEIFTLKGLPLFKISYTSAGLAIMNRNANTLKKIEDYGKNSLQPELQTTYQNAKKIGFLNMNTRALFSPWKQFFFVLTDLGLIYFDKPGKKKPTDFIPILGGRIIENYTSLDKDRVYCFKIIFPNSDTEVILSAISQTEKSEWIDVLKEIQKAVNMRKHSLGEQIQTEQKKLPTKI